MSLSFLDSKLSSDFTRREGTLGAQMAQPQARLELRNKCVIIGIPDSRGVLNNQGNPGAEKGPEAFRSAFYKHYDMRLKNSVTLSQNLCDLGDVTLASSIEETHDRLAAVVQWSLQNGAATVFVIGGGHDFSFGSYKGHCLALPGQVIPVVNLDAHFDLRQCGPGGVINSGTPFRRIIESFPHPVAGGRALLELGIQVGRNGQDLFDYADSCNVATVVYDSLSKSWTHLKLGKVQLPLTHVQEHLEFCETCAWDKQNSLHLSLDLDVFSQSIAPGTSASTPLGASLEDLGEVMSYLLCRTNCRVVDIAELCPSRDVNDMTSRLAAGLVYGLARARLESK